MGWDGYMDGWMTGVYIVMRRLTATMEKWRGGRRLNSVRQEGQCTMTPKKPNAWATCHLPHLRIIR